MISASRPSRRSTDARRSCSSRTVPTSLNRGTTTDNCGVPRALRDMTKAPCDNVPQIVAHEIDPLSEHQRAGLELAQKIELPLARHDEPRARSSERLVRVSGVDHQFGDAGWNRS